MKTVFNRIGVLTKTDFIFNTKSIARRNSPRGPEGPDLQLPRAVIRCRAHGSYTPVPARLSGCAMAGLYLLHCHALATIARKTGHGTLMEILAWLPGLQLVPMLRVGGIGFGRFCLHVLGFCLGGGRDRRGLEPARRRQQSLLLAVGIGLLTLLACLYMLWIQWRTAAARNIPGWFGPLSGVPLFGLAVYPIIAFHDGWARPHPLGGFIGALTALAMLAPATMPLDAIESEDGLPTSLAQWTQAAESTGPRRAGCDAAETVATQDDASGAGAGTTPAPLPAEVADRPRKGDSGALRSAGRFAIDWTALAEPENMRDPDNRSRALASRRRSVPSSTDAGPIWTARPTIDWRATSNPIEEQIQGRRRPTPLRLPARSEAPKPAEARAKPTRRSPPRSPPVTRPAPTRPFPVRISEACPPQTELRTRSSEKGEEEWCQQLAQYGGLRHGWYVRYFENGRPEQVGEYRDGLRVGVWTRFFTLRQPCGLKPSSRPACSTAGCSPSIATAFARRPSASKRATGFVRRPHFPGATSPGKTGRPSRFDLPGNRRSTRDPCLDCPARRQRTRSA